MKKTTKVLQQHNHKSKVKHKAKQKLNKFNPLQYLNSLIDQIHDQRFQTVRKKSNSLSRSQRASALAYVTPITERTYSHSKPRSKSSFSQHRKKSTMKDILKIELKDVITEEDNIINFTEETVYNDMQDSKILKPGKWILSRALAAKKIQRAWRRYKTLKMLKKYEILDDAIWQNNKGRQSDADISIKKVQNTKKDFQRTLKIKRNHINQYSPLQNTSQNTTKQLFRYPLPHALLQSIPTIQLPHSKSKNLQNSLYQSKQLKKIQQLFEDAKDENKMSIDQQMQMRLIKQLSRSQLSFNQYVTEDKQQYLLNIQNKSQIFPKTLSHTLFSQMQRTILQKYELFKQQIKTKIQKCTTQSYKILKNQLQQYEGRMRRQLRALNKCKNNYQNNINQLKHKMIQLHINNIIIDKLKIKNNKNNINNINNRKNKSINNNKIRKCYSAQNFIINSILEDINIKHIDIQIDKPFNVFILSSHLKNINKNQYRNDQQHFTICPTSPPSGVQNNRIMHTQNKGYLDYDKGCSIELREISCQKQQEESLHNESSILNQESSLEIPDVDIEMDLVDKDSQEMNYQEIIVINGTQARVELHSQDQPSLSGAVVESQQGISVVKQCCQQLQQIIQKNLIEEIAQQIFLSINIYTSFKPYTEHPFIFKSIADHDIYYFINNQLPMFQPKPTQLHKKINQKINPTSLEILKLIRDFDFQIDQYELILSEDIFKAYRNYIELTYASKVIPPSSKDQKSTNKQKREDYKTQQQYQKYLLSKLITEKQFEKKTKKAKFYSFQRDLKIMYMKSVFNCLNELIIETKSFHTFMTARSSIGPGQLTLAIKQYNLKCNEAETSIIMKEAKRKVQDLVKYKCMLPIFRNIKELQLFQKQINSQIDVQFKESQYKWVNYMDEVLQIWQQLSLAMIQDLIHESVQQILSIS